MITDSFSFRRLWQVLVLTTVYHQRQLLTLFTSSFLAFSIVDCFFIFKWHSRMKGYDIDVVLRDVAQVSMLVLLALMCLFVTYAFRRMHRKHEGRELLMLPASNLEKYLAHWILYVPVGFVLLVVAFMLGDLLRIVMTPLLYSDMNIPTAIPMLFDRLAQVFWRQNHFEVAWALMLSFHSLSLFSSVWLGRLSWMLVLTVFFGLLALALNAVKIGVPDINRFLFAYLVPAAFTIGSYWLFCRFPKSKLFHFKKEW